MMLTPILKPTLNPVLRGISGSITRFFTELDDVAQSYIRLSSSVDILSNYAAELDVFASYGGAMVVFGNSTQSFRNVVFISDGNIFLRDDASVNIETSSKPIPENQLSRVKIVRLGGNVEVFVNGVSVLSAPHGGMMIDQLGVRNANELPFNGIIANVKIIDNGTTVLDMPIDQNYTPTNNTVIDRASGNNGTFINVAEGDSTRYTLGDGEWVDSSGNVLEIAY